METRKIAFACFVGGVLCCGVALLFAPFYWWLGLIAGLAGGYISYEFREVRRAIPIALRAAGMGSVGVWEIAITKANTWLSKPHPFFYPSAVMITPLFVWLAYFIIPYVMQGTMKSSLPLKIILTPIFFVEVVMGFIFLTWLAIVPFFTLAFIGARLGKRCYWQPFVMVNEKDLKDNIQKLQENGFREEPLTYLSVLHWTMVGVVVTIRFFAWTLWKYLAICVWTMLCFLGRFAWHLFKLIHSEKRVLCAIDGTLGGAMSYIWLASVSMSFAQQVMLVIFGGLLGAAFGVANWEIVSKRILHVVPANGI